MYWFKFLLYVGLLCNVAFSQQITSGKKSYDSKIYKILLKELKAAEKLEKSEPGLANTFRVFSTRVEILKFLKTKNVEDSLKAPESPETRIEAEQIDKFYQKTKSIASKIDADKKFPERAKFLLLYGLTIYDFEEKDTKIAKILKEAMVLLKENELKHLAASKLGDFYFNMPDYKEAAKYYSEAHQLDSASEWRTRHLYNLGWCFFKQENFEKAIKYLFEIYTTAKSAEEKKDYYYQQAVQKIPYFYLYNNDPDRGYLFIKKNKGIQGTETINFLKEIYNKGFFDKLDSLMIDVENTLETQKKDKELLAFQLEMYSHIASREYKKNYSMLNRLRKGIVNAHNKHILEEKEKQQFISENKELLNQHLKQINSKLFEVGSNLDDKLVLEDSTDILRVLILLDPNGSASYRLKLAQLYNKTGGQRDQAMKMLWEDYLKYGATDNPEAGPYLAEILAVVDAMGDKAPTQNLERIYQDYLKVGKDQNIRKIVYLKYFDLYFNRGDFKGAMSLIKRHQQEFPKELDDRRDMVVKLLNQSLKQKDKVLFDQIREQAKIDLAINSNREIMKSINSGHNTFLLEKVNKSLTDEKSDKAIAASKLSEIFRSNSIDRTNQLISGFNAGLIFINIGRPSESQQVYQEFIDQLNPNEFKEYHDKVATIADNQLIAGNEDYAAVLFQKLNLKNCQANKSVNPNDVQKLFELNLIKQNDSAALDLLASADKCRWGDDLRKKIYYLILEYLPWSDTARARQFLKYIFWQKVNRRDDIEKNLESLYVVQLNRRDFVTTDIALQVIQDLENSWLGPLNYSSDFTKDVKSFLLKTQKLKPYIKERITPKNFAKFIEKNFDNFGSNLDVMTSFKPNYPTVFQLKLMMEIREIKNFLAFFDEVGPLIDDEKNKSVYIDQIKEALKPIEEKLKTEDDKYYKFLQTEATLLTHRYLGEKNYLSPVSIPPFILDRL